MTFIQIYSIGALVWIVIVALAMLQDPAGREHFLRTTGRPQIVFALVFSTLTWPIGIAFMVMRRVAK